MLCFQYLKNLHPQKNHSVKNMTFSLRRLIGIRPMIMSLISLFPFGLIGEYKWVSKCFMVNVCVDISPGKS